LIPSAFQVLERAVDGHDIEAVVGNAGNFELG
jgi:hypothetical protein